MAFILTPATPQENGFVQFGANLFFEWDFGDDSFSQLMNPSHVYADPGAYYVTLTVYDSESNILHSESRQIEVTESMMAFPARFGMRRLGRALMGA